MRNNIFVEPAPLVHRINYNSFPRALLDDVSNDRLDRNSSRGAEDARYD